ncbi:Dabb family protein [Undibacterium sp.]|uniref:Dabb family protein n=1 Tax=Undibacterium sp. TaxID=1914977 RepID=UPI00374DD264
MTIRHIVLLRLKEDAAPNEVEHCLQEFAKLQLRIPGITAFEQGPNVSPEKAAKGFNHVAVISFVDAAARDAYLPHPAHQAFVGVLKPLMEDLLVFDYEA